MFDTHCHLSEAPFATSLAETLHTARGAGVAHFLCISAHPGDWQAVSDIAQRHASVTPVFGIHPLLIPADDDTALSTLHTYLHRHPAAAVGEIGLDFYHRPDKAQQQRQMDFFTRQIMLARNQDRPLVLHQRKAQDLCLRQLRENHFARGGFAHAFSGSIEQAKQWLDAGFVIGIGTVLLREHSRLRKVLPYLPRDGWVAESDAPFMSPDNHPAQVARIIRLAAALRREPAAEVAAYTSANARRILHRPDSKTGGE